MAKLTQEQRFRYEHFNTLEVDLTDERKVLFDYKILTPAIKKEFLDILDFAFSDTARKMSWMDTKVSSNQHFVYCENSIRVVTHIHGHRMQFNRFSTDVRIISLDYGELQSYGIRDRNRVYDKVRGLFHDYCENKLKFSKRNSYDLRYNITYRKLRTIGSDLSEVLDNIINDSSVKIKKYSLPGKPHDLKTSEKDGMIEYNHHGKVIQMKTGKGVRKFFKMHGQILSDEVVKNVSNRLNLRVSDFVLKQVSGTDIDKYYSGDYYDNSFDTGSLGSSCMRGDDAQDGNFFEVYKDNATMLILWNESSDLIIGRAILWDDVKYIGEIDEEENLKDGDKVLIMDRIYANESVYSVFKDWALENGYYRKRYQSYNNETRWRSPSTKSVVELEFSMDINLNEYNFVPYMDTFAWGDGDIVRNDEGYGWYSARSTEGILEGGDNENSYDDDDEDDDMGDDGW